MFRDAGIRTWRRNGTERRGTRTIMKTPGDLWTDLRSSFWFVPAVIVCAAVPLALATRVSESLNGSS